MNYKHLALIAIVVALLAVPAATAALTLPAPNLENKDPSTWAVIAGDGRAGFVNVENMNARAWGLEPCTKYALIYYPDPWGTPLVSLGERFTGPYGGLFIYGDPAKLVLNPADTNLPAGYKLWVVPVRDLNEDRTAFIAWHPKDYLFEVALFPVPQEPVGPVRSSGSATMAARITMDGGEEVFLQGVDENGWYRISVSHGSILNDVQTLYYQEKGEPYFDKDGVRVFSERTVGELRYSVSGNSAFEIIKPNRLIRLQINHRNCAYDGVPTFITFKNVMTGEVLWSGVLEEKQGDWAFVLA